MFGVATINLNEISFDPELISKIEYDNVLDFVNNGKWISDSLKNFNFKKNIENGKIENFDSYSFKFWSNDIRKLEVYRDNDRIGSIEIYETDSGFDIETNRYLRATCGTEPCGALGRKIIRYI